jgi:hypothetical protein
MSKEQRPPTTQSGAIDHRRRVLENLGKATHGGQAARSDPQLRMPLLVAVKPSGDDKPRSRRKRSRPARPQPDLGEL